MGKQDLTQYSDQELSLHVFNTEFLYHQRNTPNFEDILREYFIFSDEQLEVLEQDLKDEGGCDE